VCQNDEETEATAMAEADRRMSKEWDYRGNTWGHQPTETTTGIGGDA